MAINLLATLMNTSNVTETEVKTAKDGLSETPNVTLEGVNAPEFEDETPFDMEDAYASQMETSTPAPLSLPTHNDGLDDEDLELTPDHISPFTDNEASAVADASEAPTDESIDADDFDDFDDSEDTDMAKNTRQSDTDAEPTEWNRKPFDSRYFNFGGRTVNSLTRAGFTCFDDIRGMAYSELKALRGFGQGCLDEVLELLEAENQSDWLEKRKKRAATATESQEVVDTGEGSVADHILSGGDIEDHSAGQTSEEAPEVVDFTNDPAPVEDSSGSTESEAPAPVESAPQVASPKILTIGGSVSLSRPGLNIASFEMVYADVIRAVCEQASAPSISSIEYGKGWGALATTIRMNGWPQGVDVLTISKSFMGRSEVVMELRLLADLVVEG